MALPPPPRMVAHIDMDSFYASAEARRDPSLRERPVVIGADPRDGKGRGVVVSCNYPARRFGLRSAMPISEAWRLCPQAVYLRPDFEYYEALSSQVMQVIRSRAREFEQVSIDEAFVDLRAVATSLGEAEVWVGSLKEALRAETGLTCSVGLAESKSAAKIATDLHKPDGVTVIGPGKTREFLAPLPIGVIPGVGIKTELLLKDLGITKVGDLQAVEVDLLKKRLGGSGLWIWEVANGLESEPVREHELKSFSTERTLEEDSLDWALVDSIMAELASELGERVRGGRMLFRKVGIKVRFRGFETHTRETRLVTYTNDGGAILREARSLLRSFQDKKLPVRLVGLRVSEVKAEPPDQMSISAWIDAVEKKEEG
ncbi:MAG: DNA polymerase IV [Nitrososphaerales archaeon]